MMYIHSILLYSFHKNIVIHVLYYVNHTCLKHCISSSNQLHRLSQKKSLEYLQKCNESNVIFHNTFNIIKVKKFYKQHTLICKMMYMHSTIIQVEKDNVIYPVFCVWLFVCQYLLDFRYKGQSLSYCLLHIINFI